MMNAMENVARKVWPPMVLLLVAMAMGMAASLARGEDAIHRADVDATTLRGRIMCGYQGWFRRPGDAAGLGWIHWSRDSRRIVPRTLTFELWPDVTEYSPGERFAAPGFTHPDGTQAYLYSADNPQTVLRHFNWMREYGIEGVWVQHFLVGLPGGPAHTQYESHMRVMRHVADASTATGRVWAISYDIAQMPTDRIYDVLTTDWKKLVDQRIVSHPRYLHEGGRPVVQIWGFYANNHGNLMTADVANKLIDFFKTLGPYSAYMVGGGSWDWLSNPDPQWRAFYRRLDAYAPWNVGNVSPDSQGVKHASMGSWPAAQAECKARGQMWMPVVYPGFGWDNLAKKPPGSSGISRRKGEFLWEQFYRLSKMKPDCVFVAMFDEMDEGTAIFKTSSAPPVQGHFQNNEGMPSDWYLRLTGEGTKMLHGEIKPTPTIPIQP